MSCGSARKTGPTSKTRSNDADHDLLVELRALREVGRPAEVVEPRRRSRRSRSRTPTIFGVWISAKPSASSACAEAGHRRGGERERSRARAGGAARPPRGRAASAAAPSAAAGGGRTAAAPSPAREHVHGRRRAARRRRAPAGSRRPRPRLEHATRLERAAGALQRRSSTTTCASPVRSRSDGERHAG